MDTEQQPLLPSPPPASQDVPTVQSSRAEVWYLKRVHFWKGDQLQQVKVITQNFNGPCSFIAICNILILRGDIELLPPERKTVSYEFLSQLVAGYLLKRSPDVDISAALEIMPYTQKGMDLNPLFNSATSFHPGGTLGSELKLFEQAGIKLVHGWLVDPDSPESRALEATPDYDSAVTLIADADHIAKGQLVVDDAGEPGDTGAGSQMHTQWTDGERQKVETALIVRHFLDTTQSQLTYHGLFNLIALLKPGSLVALFRNSHLSVLYKREDPEDNSLYHLVTDQVFLNEPSIVWERLEDVDGGWSTFVDSDFVKASPAGGDFAGQTAEQALRAAEVAAGFEPNDEALALQLQAEEDHYALQQHEAERRVALLDLEKKSKKDKKEKEKKDKKKSDCVIM
ncbi:DUF544-domain-containing protein [Pluteus cervinus]|uniref:DUF544-domain-containing protein n=1 Tax=Pluteus cervinus TaxID=181527 RepID=A0ACD3A8S2_9AGAR|nr:DUF544-domain-containing protein [Pluteus cervinus]